MALGRLCDRNYAGSAGTVGAVAAEFGVPGGDVAACHGPLGANFSPRNNWGPLREAACLPRQIGTDPRGADQAWAGGAKAFQAWKNRCGSGKALDRALWMRGTELARTSPDALQCHRILHATIH